MIQPKQMGRANWLGFYTLYLREVRRFWKVAMQTLFAPIVTTLLFYAVFALALGGNHRIVDNPNFHNINFMVFLAPGLIMMGMVQNAFANTSSSLIIAKVQGNIVDILMPPLSNFEIAGAITLGGMTRGLLVGLGIGSAIYIFVQYPITHPAVILFFALNACFMLSIIGVLGGIWADKFDHMATITNFIITPASFLSGTFYSIEKLPEFWQTVVHFNPFFYMIDGFRYGFIGASDAAPMLGGAILLSTNIILATLTMLLLKSGYKLKP